MNAGSQVRLVSAAIVLTLGAAGQAFAQGTMVRPKPASGAWDSSGHLKIHDSAPLVRGVVVLADGSVPAELVSIYSECGGVRNLAATAGSKGRFSFNPATVAGAATANACVVRAFLEGYHSGAQPLTDLNPKSGEKLGDLVLQPLSPDPNGLVSASDEQAGKAQRKMYEKALDRAAARDSQGAIAELRKAVSAYPDYSSAWLTLGILQRNGGDRIGAEKSFLEAARADPKFALPLIAAASLEASQGDWRAALDHSQKAINLNPAAFPDAYALNAMSNVSLQNVDAAEKSARAGLALDTDRQYPELEYTLGIISYSRNDVEEAAKHLRSYVNRAPDGPNAAVARNELAQMQTAVAAPVPTPSSPSPADRIVPLNELPPAAGPGPALASLQDRNAPLLAKTPDHICLETISRTKIDTRGRPRDAGLIRLEIAMSGGKEIYGYVDGKRFSNERLPGMLGDTFSTTGLYSSIADALIAGNAKIVFGGKELLNGESVFRYNFQVPPGEAGWSIHYGKESGQAGEEGSFFVDSSGLILREISVRAVDMPRNLKLKALDAVIGYAPETIAGRRVLLPYAAQVHVEEASGIERVSRMFFNHCRAFTAESTLSFDTNNPQALGNQPPPKPDLPPDLDIAVALRSPVSLASASANDALTATVTEPVFSKGHEIIARAAILEGHVRPIHGQNSVVIELDRVQTRSGWAPFYARLVSLASTAQAKAESPDPSKQSAADPEIPGVARIDFTAKPAELAAGTRMIWKTEPLALPPETHLPQLNTSMDMH